MTSQPSHQPATPAAAAPATPVAPVSHVAGEAPVGPEVGSPLSRRGFLRAATIAGGGLVALGTAACSPTAAPAWSFPAAG